MSEAPSNAAFLALELPSYVANDLTPRIDGTGSAIRIVAPTRIIASPGMRFPVCAAAQIVDSGVRLGDCLWDSVVAVMVDIRSNRTIAGTLEDPFDGPAPYEEDAADEAPAAAPEDPDTVQVEIDGPMQEAGNFDLCRVLPVPPVPTSYFVHFTLGPHQSNVVRVDVVRDTEE